VDVRLEITNGIAIRNVACKCSSVSLDRKADLLIFIDEKNYSQTYVVPNIAIISDTFLWKETASEWCHTANQIPPSGLLRKRFLRQRQTEWQIVQVQRFKILELLKTSVEFCK